MNVFGAFTFGSLIKIFLPGLIWVLALVLLWRDAHAIFPLVPPPLTIDGEEQNLLVLAIPASIMLGLLSNIVVFMGLNDVLVRSPIRRRQPDLFELYDWLVARIRQESWDKLGCADAGLQTLFMAQADAELLVLNKVGMSELIYVREQYWYHMEFQVNLALALLGVLAGLLLAPQVRDACDAYADCGPAIAAWVRCLVEVVTLGGLCVFLRTGALKNDSRHVAKMCALMTAVICRDADDLAGAAKPSP